MQSITDLHSSVYLTAIGMNTRRRYDDPFDDLDGERPIPASLFARIKSQFFLAISRIRKLGLKSEQDLLADRKPADLTNVSLALPDNYLEGRDPDWRTPQDIRSAARHKSTA
jgi:hypothetical protein